MQRANTAETAAFYGWISTFGNTDAIMRTALRVERPCSPFSHAIYCEKNCSRFSDCNNNQRLYLLIVFDLVVHYVRRRLFNLWPGEGDAVVRGRVFPDLSHQSRTCGDTTKLRAARLSNLFKQSAARGLSSITYLTFILNCIFACVNNQFQ